MMKFLKTISILLSIGFVVGLGIYLIYILPGYLACEKSRYEGDSGVGKNIWGDKIECNGENGDIVESMFQFSSLILIGLAIALMITWMGYRKMKSKIKD